MVKKEDVLEYYCDNLEKNDVLEYIAKHVASKYNVDEQEVILGFNVREQEVSTGFEDGFAIPHTKITNLKAPVVTIVKTYVSSWPSMDKNATEFVIAILVPKDAGDEHLKILSNLTRKLVSEDFRAELKSANAKEIAKLINDGYLPKDEVKQSVSKSDFYVAVTKCPVGIAHTYMAAEKLETAARELGVKIKVETQGSAGIENKITHDDLLTAKAVIICADAAIDNKARFNNQKVLETPIKLALEDAKALIKKADEAPIFTSNETDASSDENVSLIKACMNGVSHMIPFVVVGGLLIALSLSIGGNPTPDGLVIPEGSIWLKVNQIGVIGFTLMIPILAGYIAVAIAGRAALAPAMIGAMIANDPTILGTDAGTGFLGALAVGIIAGYLVNWMNSWKIKKELRPVMPIFVIPIIGVAIISILFIGVLGKPIEFIMNELNALLTFLASKTYLKIFLGMFIGAMISFDMGGPVNKVAFLFGVAAIPTNPEIMGAVAAAIAVPPLAMGIATFIRPQKFTEEERGTGIAALLMGLIGITEGAIPFAAGDPKKVIPSIMIGSMLASTLALIFNVTNMVPHGGPIVGILGATTNTLFYFIAILAGAISAAIIVTTIKNDVEE